MILCFRLPNFHVSSSALFFAHYFSPLILHRRNLDTFYLNLMFLCYGAICKVTMTLHHAVCSNAKCLRHTLLSTKMVSFWWLWHVWIGHYVFAIVLYGNSLMFSGATRQRTHFKCEVTDEHKEISIDFKGIRHFKIYPLRYVKRYWTHCGQMTYIWIMNLGFNRNR